MQAGDILLYKHGSDFISTVIAKFTSNGDKDAVYSHVGVAINDTDSIEAHSEDGVQIRRPALTGRDIVVIDIRQFHPGDADIQRGLDFLHDMVGSPYSYADILDNLPLLKRLGVSLAVQHRFDCSHLVADYITRLNCILSSALEKVATDSAVFSPNDIYRAIRAAGGH